MFLFSPTAASADINSKLLLFVLNGCCLMTYKVFILPLHRLEASEIALIVNLPVLFPLELSLVTSRGSLMMALGEIMPGTQMHMLYI